MDEFTSLDWVIVGVVLVIGLLGAIIKAFYIDDPEIKDYYKYKKTKSKD